MQVAFLQSSTKSTHVEPFRRVAPERLVVIITLTLTLTPRNPEWRTSGMAGRYLTYIGRPNNTLILL